jgi:hypothetical protein
MKVLSESEIERGQILGNRDCIRGEKNATIEQGGEMKGGLPVSSHEPP